MLARPESLVGLGPEARADVLSLALADRSRSHLTGRGEKALEIQCFGRLQQGVRE